MEWGGVCCGRTRVFMMSLFANFCRAFFALFYFLVNLNVDLLILINFVKFLRTFHVYIYIEPGQSPSIKCAVPMTIFSRYFDDIPMNITSQFATPPW